VLGYTFGDDDEWQYVFQNDVGWQQGANAFPGIAPAGANGARWAEWYGINQYLFYKINDCWKAGLRAEWFRDDDGDRVTGLRNPNNSIFGDNFVGNFYEISAGLNWTPSANLTVRPELRYDWIDQDLPPSVAGSRPYAGQNRVDQWLAGFIVYLWPRGPTATAGSSFAARPFPGLAGGFVYCLRCRAQDRGFACALWLCLLQAKRAAPAGASQTDRAAAGAEFSRGQLASRPCWLPGDLRIISGHFGSCWPRIPHGQRYPPAGGSFSVQFKVQGLRSGQLRLIVVFTFKH
jgi:hypothetical protein